VISMDTGVRHDALLGRRVTSPDYGRGRVVAVLPTGVQVWYDLPLTGTVDTHMLVHDPAYVERWLDQ
jgi:hypothetical protein